MMCGSKPNAPNVDVLVDDAEAKAAARCLTDLLDSAAEPPRG